MSIANSTLIRHRSSFMSDQERDHTYGILKMSPKTLKDRGIKGRKMKQKVIHHANLENPQRCFVRLYKLYMSHCLPDCPKDALCLQPLLNPKSQCWYAAKSIGHCKLDETISRMCERAGIPGYKTNHSLRATNATWFYQAGVDEQLIME